MKWRSCWTDCSFSRRTFKSWVSVLAAQQRECSGSIGTSSNENWTELDRCVMHWIISRQMKSHLKKGPLVFCTASDLFWFCRKICGTTQEHIISANECPQFEARYTLFIIYYSLILYYYSTIWQVRNSVYLFVMPWTHCKLCKQTHSLNCRLSLL